MVYQSPIPLRKKRANPFDVFLRDPTGDGPDPSIEAARQQARKEIAGRSRPLTDFVAQGAQSALGNLKAIPDLLTGPTSLPSEALGALSDYAGSLKSPQQQMREELAAEQMATLPEDDWYGRGLLTGQNLLSDPAMLIPKIAGNVLPFAAVGRGAKALNIGAKAAGSVTNALMGAGTIRGGAYDAAQSAPEAELARDPRYLKMRATMPESEARGAYGELVSSFEESGGKIALGGILGLATGALGAEGKIAELAARGAVAGNASKSIAVNALKNLATEGVSEFGEEGAQQYLSNLSAGVNPMRGVAEGAVEGGLIGAGMGGGVGLAESAADRFQNRADNRAIVARPEPGVPAIPPSTPPPVAPPVPFPTQENLTVQETDELPDDPEGELTAEEIAARSVPSPIDDIDPIIAEARANALVEQPLEAVESLPQPLPEVPNVVEPLPVLEDSSSAVPQLADPLPVIDETLPPAEGVDAVDGAVDGFGAPETQPLVAPDVTGMEGSGVGVPDGSVEVQERIPEGNVQPVGIESAPAATPLVATGVPAVDTTTLAPDRSSETVGFERPTDGAVIAPVNASPDSVVAHAQTVAQPKTAVKASPIKGLDRVKVGDRFGTVNSRQKDGTVNVSFDDGSVQRVPISSVSPAPAAEVGESLEVVEDKLPETPHGIIGAVKNAFPKKSKQSDAFQKAASDFEADISNVDKMAAFLRAARAGAFDAVVEAVRSGKDPIKAANRLAVHGKSAQELVEKAKKYVAKQGVSEDVDLETPLKASIEANQKPTFSRDESPEAIRNEALEALSAYHKASFADVYNLRVSPKSEPNAIQKLLAKAFSTAESVYDKAQGKILEAFDPEFAEKAEANYAGESDEERASSWKQKVNTPAAPVLGTSKFNIYDFEGDVDKSVIDGLSKLTKGLADAISSTGSRIATTAGLKQGSFAGFAPNGNLAGVSYKGKWYLNPLKHIKSNDSVKIAKAIVKTMVHEMAHVNGFSRHNKAFEAEVDRITKAVSNLIPGMEREIAQFFDKQTISKLRGLYDTAEKGWTVARQKGRDRALADERRQLDRPVPSVQPKVDRDGSLPPPAPEGSSRSDSAKVTSGKTEELGSVSEPRPTSESASGEGDGRPSVLEPPSFAKEAEEEEEAETPTEIVLPEETDSQKRVAAFVNKFNRIGEMHKFFGFTVKNPTGPDYDIDLEEMAIALAPQTAAKLRKLKDYTVKPLMELLGKNGISILEAEKYIHAKAAGEDVSEIENGPKADVYRAAEAAFLEIVKEGNSALSRAGMKAGGLAVDPDRPASGILQRAVEQSSRAIVKAQENIFRRHVSKFIASNPSKEWAINPKNQAGGHTVSFQQDGKKQRIWFKDKTLAKQVENLSDGETSQFMSGVRQGTQMFARLNTRANPVFPIKNFVRDLFFGLGKIYVDDGSPRMMEVLRTVLPAYKALIAYHRDPEKNKDSEWGKLAKLMTTAGGIPEWFGLPDEASIRTNLEREIKEFDGSKSGMAYKPFKAVWNAMKIFSEASEGATRLAYLKTLLDAHTPIQEAIKKTRGVTGDFQRHGHNKNMRYAYAFFNSSIQGMAAMKKLTDDLRDGNPRARNLALMLVGIGMSQALIGAAAGDDDDDGQNDYDQLPEYLKNSNLIIPVPGHPVTIPLPYGLNVPIVLGMGVMNTLMDKKKAGISAWNLQASMLKSFNPMGDDSTLAQMLSPTLVDPIIQAGENIDSLGRKIHRDRYPGEARLPDSQITSKKDSSQAKAVAAFLNDYSGGSETEKGLFDVHPAVIDNTARWVIGAAGRFVKDLYGAGLSVRAGEMPEKIPFWNDFVKTPQDYFYTGRFWDQLEEIRGLKDSAKQLDENARKDQLIELGMDPDRVESFSRTDLKNVRLSGSRSNALQKEIEAVSGKRAKLLPMYEELRKQISALQKSGDEGASDRIKELVKAANRKYMEATR